MAKQKKRASFRTQNINPGVGGFAVTREKYEPLRRAVLTVLPRGRQGITFAELVRRVVPQVKRRKDLFPHRGSVDWYTKVVQLDLEKKGLIVRIPGTTPLRLRRK